MASIGKREWKSASGEIKSGWEVRYKLNGKHHSTTFKKKKDAEQYKRKVESDILNGSHVPLSESVTVRELCDRFLKRSEDRLRAGQIGRTHLKTLTWSCEKMIEYLGHVMATELTAVQVEDAYRSIVRAGKLSPSSAREVVKKFRLVEEYAVKRQLMRSTPVTIAARELRGIVSAPVRTFSVDQIGALLRAAAERPPRAKLRSHLMTKCVVNIAAFCGLRFGEIMGLTVPSIDFDNSVIQVRHSLTRFNELKCPKTRAGVRDVPMPHHVKIFVREWIEKYYIENDRTLVFMKLNRKGGIVSGSFQQNCWRELLRRAGLLEGDPFHFHALRHFCASWMIENGLPITEVATLLGHSHVDTTLQTYAHPVVGAHRQRAIFEKMAQRVVDAPLTIDLEPEPGPIAHPLRMPA